MAKKVTSPEPKKTEDFPYAQQIDAAANAVSAATTSLLQLVEKCKPDQVARLNDLLSEAQKEIEKLTVEVEDLEKQLLDFDEATERADRLTAVLEAAGWTDAQILHVVQSSDEPLYAARAAGVLS